jgi:hypothetical protein
MGNGAASQRLFTVVRAFSAVATGGFCIAITEHFESP